MIFLIKNVNGGKFLVFFIFLVTLPTDDDSSFLTFLSALDVANTNKP